MDHDEPITDGIDITNWPVPIKDGDQLVFSVWDFAGQTVYYNTHQVSVVQVICTFATMVEFNYD